ncbi:hypothetical protein EDM56_17690 [Brevibacillus fluminis]|uniref:Cytosolic protein n=1 Tax=Brevibacillus fluminis TaxID=511487 RepID=A0A3M8DCN8_9BACL|nr:DUF6154 family protein [Brevibacillus fluminis]RNB85832.1 hypothetical protein EDM56_17690 [Brevibacillus fluminis]
MRFVDQLYEMYRGHFNGAEEDIIAIVVGTLQEQSADDLNQLIDEMEEEEVFHMVANYFIEVLKRKVAMEDERPRDVLH